MATIETIPCVPCVGKGTRYQNVTGNYIECKACEGSGEVYPCEAFTSSRPAAFRNRTCDNCHATEKQHELLAELKKVQEVNA